MATLPRQSVALRLRTQGIVLQPLVLQVHHVAILAQEGAGPRRDRRFQLVQAAEVYVGIPIAKEVRYQRGKIMREGARKAASRGVRGRVLEGKCGVVDSEPAAG